MVFINNNDITEALKILDPIDLETIGSASSIDRIDTKYVFPVTLLSAILKLAGEKFSVLEINSFRTHKYSTIYMDTGNFDFYYRHMTGRLPRCKVRFRKYEQTNDTFLEIKRATNKGRTIKNRIESQPDKSGFSEEAARFIEDNIPYKSGQLNVVLKNSFFRITLMEKERRERVTIDYNLEYSNSSPLTNGLPFLAIAELKREDTAYGSPFSNITRSLGIRPTGFSKYCLGNILLHSDIEKTNRMKPKLLLIDKIKKELNRATEI
jgi:hypothetical protein